ncbi:hypothetical protein AS25_08540 [Kocuria marina]|uniref:Uncharacterized protein n=1 Tax=Kocuria marina TaxID=223184 RepID=A0A0B0DDD3_9MICC|nr:hypothetical protein AS25_08540 [Kocuria marina]
MQFGGYLLSAKRSHLFQVESLPLRYFKPRKHPTLAFGALYIEVQKRPAGHRSDVEGKQSVSSAFWHFGADVLAQGRYLQ